MWLLLQGEIYRDIINKRGEFASKVTDYINQFSENVICGNYHDKVEPIPALDDILYSGGVAI